MSHEHIALVIIAKPDPSEREATMKWQTFSATLAKMLDTDAQSEALAENVWQFDLRNALLPFCALVTAAHEHRLPCKVRLFSEAPLVIEPKSG